MNFWEFPFPGNSVNKGMKKGRGCYRPRPKTSFLSRLSGQGRADVYEPPLARGVREGDGRAPGVEGYKGEAPDRQKHANVRPEDDVAASSHYEEVAVGELCPKEGTGDDVAHLVGRLLEVR